MPRMQMGAGTSRGGEVSEISFGVNVLLVALGLAAIIAAIGYAGGKNR